MIDILKALADETRLRIVGILLNNELCVCEVEKCLKLTQSNASRHLSTLKNAGILKDNKKAQWIYYTINEEFINQNKELYDYLYNRLNKLSDSDNDKIELEKIKTENLCSNSMED